MGVANAQFLRCVEIGIILIYRLPGAKKKARLHPFMNDDYSPLSDSVRSWASVGAVLLPYPRAYSPHNVLHFLMEHITMRASVRAWGDFGIK